MADEQEKVETTEETQESKTETTETQKNEAPAEKPAEKPADKPAEKPTEKPADAKIELKLSEGSLLTKDDLTRIADYASKQGLNQEQAAQRLSEEEALAKRGADAYEQKQQELLASENKRWIETCKADPEIGGDKFSESAELAKRVVEKFGTKELKEGLERSGLGNYHEFVRLMSRIGRAMDSDKLIIGDMNNKQPKSLEERLYSKK